MGEVTPEMVERLKMAAALGANALMNEAIYTVLSEWEKVKKGNAAERLFLFLLCPHAGKYGDDGEMQCQGGRPWDFKRSPIEEIRAHVLEALQAESAKHHEAERSLAEARAEIARMCELGSVKSALSLQDERQELIKTKLTLTRERDSAREKLAKVVRLIEIIKRANEPCDAEDGYCVHCACVEALAVSKGVTQNDS